MTVPTDTVFARGLGSISFVCPVCNAINGPKPIDWRRARCRCLNDECNRRWRIGFCFDPQWTAIDLHDVPPFTAVTLPFPPRGERRVNRLGRLCQLASRAIATYSGPLEYLCPTCHAWNRSRINAFGCVTCSRCIGTWNVSVILWSNATRLHSPIDWSVNRELQDTPPARA